jgi:hypothetical protein
MRVTRLSLRNYRCFEWVDIDLDQTTVLVGANDTGKSAVLEALRWLLAPDESCDWSSAVRRVSLGEHDHPSALILAEFDDLTPPEKQGWDSLTSEGVIRLAKSSLTGDRLCWAADRRGITRLIGQLDRDTCESILGTREDDLIAEALMGIGDLVAFNEDLTLVDLGLFQYGIEPFERLVFALSSTVSVVSLGGPTDASWSPEAVVRPIIEARLHELFARPDVERGMSVVQSGLVDLGRYLSGAHSMRLDPAAGFTFAQWQSNLEYPWLVDAIIDVITGTYRFSVSRKSGPERLWPAEKLGPGSRRSLALTALNLYADPSLNPRPGPTVNWASDLVLLLVEEPETGLHASAQRRLAKSLRDLATFGLQLVIVTHSPIFLNAVSTDGIRLSKRIGATDGGSAARLLRPTGLAEVRDALGIEPADILLARRFVIVEGDCDRLVLMSWAKRLGLDLAERGVQVVPSNGWTKAERAETFLELAYEGAEFVVVMDNGPDTPSALESIRLRHGDRVETILLSEPAIEGYYHPNAVVAWLASEGAALPDLRQVVENALAASTNRYKAIQDLCSRYLGHQLRKVFDGQMIADLTREQDIHPEIRDVLMRVGRD